MSIPASVDGESLVCATSLIKWTDIDLQNIITSVFEAPAINPWEWSKEGRGIISTFICLFIICS